MDISKIKRLVDLAIGAAGMTGAQTPAFQRITQGLSKFLGETGLPGAEEQKVRFDTTLAAAVAERKAAFDRARQAGGFIPKG